LRSGSLFSNRGTSALDASEQDRASMTAKSAGLKRGAAVTEMPLRRDSSYPNDFADGYGFDSAPEFADRQRRPGVRISIRGGLVPIPTTLWGRIAAGAGLLLLTGAAIVGALLVRSFLLHDQHFMVASSESIQIAGNSHLTRPQLLSVFGEDVDRNLFTIPLAQRRAELESLPWVEHATVMRFLPNRVRVAIVERTPVAFVRQGTRIGLVDANGVLFDLPGPEMERGTHPTAPNLSQYSFPVLTGISTGDPLSTRAARMRIYTGFVSALDAGGEGISRRLSEVDVSNPEDVQAVIPDPGATGADILVHFGEEKFLDRYHQYQQHLAEWRAQYPKLASVDMRYERQVVLQMQPGAPAPIGDSAPAAAAPPGHAALSPAAPAPATPAKASTAKASAAAARKSWLARKKQAARTIKPKGKLAVAASQGAQ